MKNSKTTSIALNNYSELLINIKNKIAETQNNAIKTIARQKVVMAWQIGKEINDHLSRNTKSGYGEHLLKQLEQDINISGKVLYKMRNFYQTYPQLPKDDDKLNWSHYRILSGIKEEQARQYLEDLTKEQSWGTHRLEEEAVKSKGDLAKDSQAKNDGEKLADEKIKNSNKHKAAAKLKPKRGQLFSYPLIKLEGSSKSYIDLGFNIFKEIEEELPKSTAIDVKKIQQDYSFVESGGSSQKFNTYKAYVERVVDGDTIRVTIDLGFKIFHKEIIRLRGVDAPEINSKDGKRSCKILKNILEDIPFLIIKTTKIDIYGRYVADIYASPSGRSKPLHRQSEGGLINIVSKEAVSPQQVADQGIYLNQLLVDKGAVRVLKN